MVKERPWLGRLRIYKNSSHLLYFYVMSTAHALANGSLCSAYSYDE